MHGSANHQVDSFCNFFRHGLLYACVELEGHKILTSTESSEFYAKSIWGRWGKSMKEPWEGGTITKEINLRNLILYAFI